MKGGAARTQNKAVGALSEKCFVPVYLCHQHILWFKQEDSLESVLDSIQASKGRKTHYIVPVLDSWKLIASERGGKACAPGEGLFVCLKPYPPPPQTVTLSTWVQNVDW